LQGKGSGKNIKRAADVAFDSGRDRTDARRGRSTQEGNDIDDDDTVKSWSKANSTKNNKNSQSLEMSRKPGHAPKIPPASSDVKGKKSISSDHKTEDEADNDSDHEGGPPAPRWRADSPSW
jgi:hypothetical protein